VSTAAEPRRPSKSIYTSWWFGHLLLFVLCGGVILAAAVMEPSNENLTLFGFEVPMVCGWRRMTGWRCLGCGMTRSFVFLAHGHIVDAFWMNYAGPLLFAFMAAQPPYRLWKLAQGLRSRRWPRTADR